MEGGRGERGGGRGGGWKEGVNVDALCYVCQCACVMYTIPTYTALPCCLICENAVFLPVSSVCAQEAVALVSKLQYNTLFDPAVKRVFGKTLVCRTLEAASQLAKSDELDCVTLDGEEGGAREGNSGGGEGGGRAGIDSTRTVQYGYSVYE